MANPDRRRAQFSEVRAFVGEVFGADLHAKRIDSLAGATLSVMQSASLAVAMIGQALAQARGLITKHAIKQSMPPQRRGSIGCSATTVGVPVDREHRFRLILSTQSGRF